MVTIAEKKKAITFASILKNQIYKNRDILHTLVPSDGLLHRTEQKNELVMELAPILMNSAVNCVFLYGNPGTGKTAIVTELAKELEDEANNNKIELHSAYVNCSENRTETTILIEILNQISDKTYPRIGWTRSRALAEFTKVLNDNKSNVLIVLDEVDYTLKESGDDIIYRLSRINNNVDAKVSSILISNDIKVADYIKPKTQSTLGRVKIIFSPYNAEELQDILGSRAKDAFYPNVVSEAVMQKIAEIESSRGGDARKALELLDACAKIAVAKNLKKVSLDLVDAADMNLEKDSVLNMIATLTKHQKLLYLAILKSKKKEQDGGQVFNQYVETCSKHNVEALSVRSVRTFLVHFDELGLLESEVTWLRDLNKKSRKIKLDLDASTVKKARKLIRDTL